MFTSSLGWLRTDRRRCPVPVCCEAHSFLERRDELYKIVSAFFRRRCLAAHLQIAPAQLTVDAIEQEPHPLLRSLNLDFHETLKEWRVIQIKHTREGFDTRRIATKPIHPLQKWCLPKRQLID